MLQEVCSLASDPSTSLSPATASQRIRKPYYDQKTIPNDSMDPDILIEEPALSKRSTPEGSWYGLKVENYANGSCLVDGLLNIPEGPESSFGLTADFAPLGLGVEGEVSVPVRRAAVNVSASITYAPVCQQDNYDETWKRTLEDPTWKLIHTKNWDNP